MLLMIGRALNMLRSQIRSQGKAFEETGGFSERLMTKCIKAREESRDAEAPACPACEYSIRKRRFAKGEFLGCSRFPDCKGTRPI